MKIFQIIPSLSDGGAERFVVDLCNQLAENNHEVTICSLFELKGNHQFYKNELAENVNVISLNKMRGFDISVFKKLNKVLNDYKPDIVHTHARALNYLLPLIFKTKQYKVIHTIHNDAKKEVQNKYEKSMRYWFYKKKKIIPVTISKESDKTFVETYPCIKSKVIYNGIRMPIPSPQFQSIKEFIETKKTNINTRVFIHIGRLKLQKNQLLLIESFKKVLNQNMNALLIMIGSEREDAESHSIAQAIKQACNSYKNIIWLGGNKPATDYLMLSDFFCLSSIYEGMPISLIESFATGCIPVCTPVGGIPEMINENGFLSEDLSEDAYYNALAKAYAYPAEKLAVLKNKFVELFNEKYTMQSCAKEYEIVYKQVIGEKWHMN